jgi:hypothetical protein
MKTTPKITFADSDEMPEIDIKRAKVIGTGIYFRKLAAQNRFVQLDPDVSKDFQSAKDVNDALRIVQQIRRLEHPRKQRKTA